MIAGVVVLFLALIVLLDECCRIVVEAADPGYTENSANGCRTPATCLAKDVVIRTLPIVICRTPPRPGYSRPFCAEAEFGHVEDRVSPRMTFELPWRSKRRFDSGAEIRGEGIR